MDLPKTRLPESTVEIDGQAVAIKSLSRSQAMKVSSFMDDPDAGEDFILACGTGVSVEEAHEWRANTDLMTAGRLVDAIIELSGMVPAKG